jgi:hypothetical protein
LAVDEDGTWLVGKPGSLLEVQPSDVQGTPVLAHIWVTPPGAFDILRAIRAEFVTEFRVCEDPLAHDPEWRDAELDDSSGRDAEPVDDTPEWARLLVG